MTLASDAIRTDLPSDRWDAFVRSQSGSTFYHLSGWQDVVRSAFSHKTHYLSLCRGDAVAGVFPLAEINSRLFGHALISTPYCVGGGPLAVDKVALEALLGAAEDLGRSLGVDYIEMRDVQAARSGWLPREGQHAAFERKIAADEAECLKQIPRKQRAVVRKTLTSDLSFKVDNDLSAFFRLHSRTFRNHGTPVFPKRYYDSLMEVFKEDCEILTVWKGREPVSSVMSFYLGQRITPYYTGSVPKARELGANDLMYWQLMRQAVSRGCTSFDFGRSKVNSGPYAFKKNWGFEPRSIKNWYFLVRRTSPPNVSPTNPKYDLAIKVWQNLPLPVANYLSRFISPDLA